MPTKKEMKPFFEESIRKLEKWLEDQDYKAHELFDALDSFARFVTFGYLFLERLLIQIFKQNTFNFRVVMGVKPHNTAID